MATIDEAARAAGRDPADIERAVNVIGLESAPDSWAQQLARIATDLRFSTLLVGVPDEDPIGFVRRARRGHRASRTRTGELKHDARPVSVIVSTVVVRSGTGMRRIVSLGTPRRGLVPRALRET